jgi:hypothetical protein
MMLAIRYHTALLWESMGCVNWVFCFVNCVCVEATPHKFLFLLLNLFFFLYFFLGFGSGNCLYTHVTHVHIAY